VDHAEVLLLPGYEDQAIWRYFASLTFPPEEQVRQTLDTLAAAGRPLSTAALEARVDLRRSRLETMLKVLDVDGAVRRVKGGWESTGQPWDYDTERYTRVAAAREDEQRAMLAYEHTDECRMVFLRRQLDDPHIEGPCGRCDNCAGARFTATAENAAPGRALGRLTDLGWGARLRELLADGTPDQQLPEPMVDGIVKVLAAWGWTERPTAVVSIGSHTRPTLVADTARRIATIGHLEYLGTVEPAAPSGQARRGNSAQRLKQVHDAFALSTELAEAIAAHQGPILLVDDRVDTGWTMTVAARMLRQAGADEVLPFALAMEA
jgi:ATP-dependent DNA helicase RecQ